MEKNDKLKQLRKKHNKDLIKKMRDGENLKSFDSFSSWFPPRPILTKDNDAIAQLYGKALESHSGLNRNKKMNDRSPSEQKIINLNASAPNSPQNSNPEAS